MIAQDYFQKSRLRSQLLLLLPSTYYSHLKKQREGERRREKNKLLSKSLLWLYLLFGSLAREYIQMASIEQELHQFITKYEINPKYGAVLHRLVDFHTVIVADDSASMASLADPDDSNNPGVTRWQELKTTMKIILEAHHALGLTVDIFFVNRGRLHNVRTIEDVERMLRAPPTGPSQILRILQEVQSLYMTEESLRDKNLILHILSDGRPTKADAEVWC